MKQSAPWFIVLVLFGGSVPGWAQPTVAGALNGHVRDQQGTVVPEATIAVAGPAVAGQRQATTDANGFYLLVDLPPGEYALSASLEGFATTVLQPIRVRTGRTFTVDVTIEVGPVDVTVDVAGRQPLIDTSTAVHAVNITGELQASLPLSVRRDWADFLLVTPGVVNNEGGFYHVHGSDFASHVMQLDGVDLAATQQNHNGYIQLNTDTLEDVQIKTAGIDAGAPLGAGAVISMASRSGADVFAGIQGVSFRARGWNANNSPGGTTSGSSLFHGDLSLGGPIQRNRWWFFGSYRRLSESSQISRTAGQIATLRALVPAFEPFTNDTRANISFVKITGQLSHRHRLYGFHQSDWTPSDASWELHAQKKEQYVLGGKVDAVGLSSIWGALLTRFVGSFNDKDFAGRALVPDPVQVVHRAVFPSAGALAGTGPIAFLGGSGADSPGRSNKWTFSGDATYYRPGRVGTHDLRAGFNLQYLHEERVVEYANGGLHQEQWVLRDASNPAAGIVPFHRRTVDPAIVTDRFGRSSDLAFYLQDHWSIDSRLTLSLGLRVDVIARSDRIFDVETQRSTEVGPRVGVSYALTTDHRSVVRASWGRVHDALSTNSIPIGDETPGVRNDYDLDLDGTFETTFITPRITTLSDRLVLDPARSQPYVNEWTVGFARQLPRNISFDASVIRREYRNRTAFVDRNGIYENAAFLGYRNPELNEIYFVTGNAWNWPVYSGLEFSIARQSGPLQLIGGYTRGFQHVAGTWQPDDPATFIQPEAFANDRGIGGVTGSTRAGASNSLSGRADVSAPQWRRHTLRTGVTFNAPWRLRLATTYSLQSGVWSGPVVTRIPAPDPAFGPPVVELASGRLVQNPLATTIRFAFPTRGDGQFMLPAVHFWNVRVGRQFALPALRAHVDVLLDVFNVLNLAANQRLMSGGNQTYNPNFGKGGNLQLPRSAELLIRLSF